MNTRAFPRTEYVITFEPHSPSLLHCQQNPDSMTPLPQGSGASNGFVRYIHFSFSVVFIHENSTVLPGPPPRVSRASRACALSALRRRRLLAYSVAPLVSVPGLVMLPGPVMPPDITEVCGIGGIGGAAYVCPDCGSMAGGAKGAL